MEALREIFDYQMIRKHSLICRLTELNFELFLSQPVDLNYGDDVQSSNQSDDEDVRILRSKLIRDNILPIV